MDKPFKVKRWGRSLITTCAASIRVANGKQSVNDFIFSALKRLNGEIYLVKEYDVDVFDAEAEDYLNVDLNVISELFKLVDLVKGKWYRERASVPHDMSSDICKELFLDLTDAEDTLFRIILGIVLALVPWRSDNTFEIPIHGTQLPLGVYQFRVIEFSHFYEEQERREAIYYDAQYYLTITEGKIKGRRKYGGGKLKKSKSNESNLKESTTKATNKKKDYSLER